MKPERVPTVGGNLSGGLYDRRLAKLITDRQDTVQAILKNLQWKKALQLSAPPYSGKTSLCQLVSEMAVRGEDGNLNVLLFSICHAWQQD